MALSLLAAAAAVPGRALEFASVPTMDAELLAFVEVLKRFEGPLPWGTPVGLTPENVPYLEEALPLLTKFAAAPEEMKQSVMSRLEVMERRRLEEKDFEVICATNCRNVYTARRSLHEDVFAERLKAIEEASKPDPELDEILDVLQRFTKDFVALKAENVAFLEKAVPVLIRFAAAAAEVKQDVSDRWSYRETTAAFASLRDEGRRLGHGEEGDSEFKCDFTCGLVDVQSMPQ